MQWNVNISNIKLEDIYLHEKLKNYYENEYLNAYNNPKIIHYCSYKKPWTNPEYDKSYLFWQYARKTYFYEEIINKNISIIIHSHLYDEFKFINKFNIGEFIFSIKENKEYKIITILGIKITLKKNKMEG